VDLSGKRVEKKKKTLDLSRGGGDCSRHKKRSQTLKREKNNRRSVGFFKFKGVGNEEGLKSIRTRQELNGSPNLF